MARMRRLSSRAALAVAVPLAAVLTWGFVEALAPPAGAPVSRASVAQPAPKRPGQYLLLALGDSLARGTGAAPGAGFVDDVASALRSGKAGFRIENLAVEGLESTGLREILSHPEARALASEADAVLVSIGGNDLSHAIGRAAGESPLAALSAARRTFEGNLEAILGDLRKLNPTAPIALLLPYDPFTEGDMAAVGAGVILDWNASAAKIAAEHDVRAVPTFDLFERRPDRLAGDKFHPNAEGYRLIAERLRQVL